MQSRIFYMFGIGICALLLLFGLLFVKGQNSDKESISNTPLQRLNQDPSDKEIAHGRMGGGGRSHGGGGRNRGGRGQYYSHPRQRGRGGYRSHPRHPQHPMHSRQPMHPWYPVHQPTTTGGWYTGTPTTPQPVPQQTPSSSLIHTEQTPTIPAQSTATQIQTPTTNSTPTPWTPTPTPTPFQNIFTPIPTPTETKAKLKKQQERAKLTANMEKYRNAYLVWQKFLREDTERLDYLKNQRNMKLNRLPKGPRKFSY